MCGIHGDAGVLLIPERVGIDPEFAAEGRTGRAVALGINPQAAANRWFVR